MAPALILEDRYRLDDRIAVGGMGEVWQATDLLLDRPVAVKLLQSAYLSDDAGLTRFRAEARYAASLSHPNIAHVYDFGGGEDRGGGVPPRQPYLVMELVDGPSLAALLEDGPLTPQQTLDIVSQAAAGLHAAHMAGVVHRDVKPGNLLISSSSGLVKIADFGIAHAMGSAPVTRTGEVIGTPGYLSPEQARGASATPASDLYELGIVAYQCLAGRLPFTGEPLAVALAHQEQPLPPLPPQIPPEVAALVAHLAAKDPRARPASAGGVAARAQHLRAALAGTQMRRRRRVIATPEAGPTLLGLPAVAGAAGAARAAAAAGDPGTAGAATAGVAAYGAADQLTGYQSPAVAHRPPRSFGLFPAAGFRAALWDRRPARAAVATAGIVVFGLAGWALSALPAAGGSGGPHQPMVPVARPSGPVIGSSRATSPGKAPATGVPNPQTVATPAPKVDRTGPAPSPSASSPASPASSATPPASPTAAPPSSSPPPSPSPSASTSPPPSPTPSPTSSPANASSTSGTSSPAPAGG